MDLGRPTGGGLENYKRARVTGIPAHYRGRRVIPPNERVFTVSAPSREAIMTRNVRARTTRKYMRRRRTGKRRGVIRPRIPKNIVPSSKLVRMEMVVPITWTVNTANVSYQAISLFNLTDPTGALGTQQPTGLDQWGAMYKYAIVTGIKVTATFHNAGTQGMVCGITPIPEAYAITAQDPWDSMVEFPGTKYRFLSPEMDHTTMTASYSTKKWMKIKDWKDNKLSLNRHCSLGASGTHTAPTTTSDYVTVWMGNHHGSTSSYPEVIVKVSYIVLLFDRRLISRSTA